ncbi:MAG: class I SAM-dependent methyltransferase, partial [Rubrivivax sp.]|nr:class I SAM-dependent methyltransferase [Rubrivivax sp.]
MSADKEPDRVAERYARRQRSDRYAIDSPGVRPMLAERQVALRRLLAGLDLPTLRLVEVGCGSGGNLLELMQLGFVAEHLRGIELLPERLAQARAQLPPALQLLAGDASQAPIAPASQDIVYASTVFSSLLDSGFQHQMAQAMWSWLKPGGAVLWYDFTVN